MHIPELRKPNTVVLIVFDTQVLPFKFSPLSQNRGNQGSQEDLSNTFFHGSRGPQFKSQCHQIFSMQSITLQSSVCGSQTLKYVTQKNMEQQCAPQPPYCLACHAIDLPTPWTPRTPWTQQKSLQQQGLGAPHSFNQF